jgi:hypothetical protein
MSIMYSLFTKIEEIFTHSHLDYTLGELKMLTVPKNKTGKQCSFFSLVINYTGVSSSIMARVNMLSEQKH